MISKKNNNLILDRSRKPSQKSIIFTLEKEEQGDANNEQLSGIYTKNLEEPIETANKITITSGTLTAIKERNRTHYLIFRKSMKYILKWGQLWGLIPVVGILDENPLNVRFQKDSFRFWYSVIVLIFQEAIALLSLVYWFSTSFSITVMEWFSFYASTSMITLLSLRVASKWPALIQEVSSSNLDVNPRLQFKCAVVFFTFNVIGLVEHILSHIANVATVSNCDLEKGLYQAVIEKEYPYVFSIVPFHPALGVFLKIITITSTINWNYTDVLIISFSFYLTSVLRKITEKLRAARDEGAPSCVWRSLREAYTRATRLVRIFDDAISSMLFVSFANNLFFICLQLFYVLSRGVPKATTTPSEKCQNHQKGLFNGYENNIYFASSLITILLRSLSVALITADVHYESLAPACVLYDIPYNAYCDEVQRFIEQVHGDKIALSGLEFFIMTRELILSVGGAIVTYELVLLQFQDQNMMSTSKQDSKNFVSNFTTPAYDLSTPNYQ